MWFCVSLDMLGGGISGCSGLETSEMKLFNDLTQEQL